MIFTVKTTGVYTTQPNQLDFVFTFITKDENYDRVVKNGAKDVVQFKEKMKDLFDVNKMKTTVYNISTKTKRVEKKTIKNTEYEYVFSHYELKQMFTLEIPYEKDVLFETIERISQIKNGPTYTFDFGLDDEKTQEAENTAMKMAINYAQEKANSVMKQLRKKTYECLENEIVEHFETNRNYYNDVQYDFLYQECSIKGKSNSLQENLSNSITPTDIKIRINVVSKFEII